jgi:protein-arginine deiminase
MQSPTIEISSEWLAVGHVDEFLMAIPDKKGTKGWKMAWASPALARKALKDMQAKGLGSALVFKGRASQKTVNTILADTKLMTFNDQVQARLDSAKAQLIAATGMVASDFVEFPVYYEVSAYGGLSYAVSQNPGVQNCIPVNDTLYVPDPEGPKDSTNTDVWRKQVTDAVSPLGLKVVFVDVFKSYHELMGEAHCGSNVLYKPYDAPWWTK